jgi:hypothetical protein
MLALAMVVGVVTGCAKEEVPVETPTPTVTATATAVPTPVPTPTPEPTPEPVLYGSGLQHAYSGQIATDEEYLYYSTYDKWLSFNDVLYFTGSELGKIYRVKKDGSEVITIWEGYCYSLNLYGDYIYFAATEFDENSGWGDNKLYRIKKDGTDLSELDFDGNRIGILIIANDYLYYTDSNQTKYRKINLRNGEDTLIDEDYVNTSSANFNDDYDMVNVVDYAAGEYVGININSGNLLRMYANKVVYNDRLYYYGSDIEFVGKSFSMKTTEKGVFSVRIPIVDAQKDKQHVFEKLMGDEGKEFIIADDYLFYESSDEIFKYVSLSDGNTVIIGNVPHDYELAPIAGLDYGYFPKSHLLVYVFAAEPHKIYAIDMASTDKQPYVLADFSEESLNENN